MKTCPTNMPAALPTIALTLGDVAGIGPEVAVRACADPRIVAACRPVIVGHPEVVRRAITHSGLKTAIAEVARPEELPPL
ncbi:MAG: 4-hydroxythreonine-4-phosphate dehydrogenase PdxA, partial [Planctomycetaceae bacterium]|nr:4-hydroxythreonine-4-phosphate dehydrogenase PdxA [Planctomycetaceae bacterium]